MQAAVCTVTGIGNDPQTGIGVLRHGSGFELPLGAAAVGFQLAVDEEDGPRGDGWQIIHRADLSRVDAAAQAEEKHHQTLHLPLKRKGDGRRQR